MVFFVINGPGFCIFICFYLFVFLYLFVCIFLFGVLYYYCFIISPDFLYCFFTFCKEKKAVFLDHKGTFLLNVGSCAARRLTSVFAREFHNGQRCSQWRGVGGAWSICTVVVVVQSVCRGHLHILINGRDMGSASARGSGTGSGHLADLSLSQCPVVACIAFSKGWRNAVRIDRVCKASNLRGQSVDSDATHVVL